MSNSLRLYRGHTRIESALELVRTPQVETLVRLYNTRSRFAAEYTEMVSQRKVPVETRKPTHASANSSCEFETNTARDRTMLAKERTVTHMKSVNTLGELGSSATGVSSLRNSFHRSKRKANATKPM